MGDQNNSEKPLSILEKFRQLSKEKEQEQCQVKEVKPVKSVDAVYLTNNTGDMPSSSDKKQRWNFNRKNERGGGKFFGKRKFDGDHSSPFEGKIKRPMHKSGAHTGLKAEDVGITEYICPYSGFGGIIKQRFSDFQVNEISEDGEVVKLTNQVVPKEPEMNKDDVNLENDEDMLKILPKEYWDKLYSIVEDEDPQDSVNIEVTDWPKDKRIQVHSAIKNLFKEKVISNTVDEGGKKVLKITYSKDGGYQAHRRALWRNKEYLHFVIHKENMDTTEAINVLCLKLMIKSKTVQVCGTKDKRAKTTQRAAVKRVMAERLQKIQPLRCITLGNYEYKSHPLKLGQLKGNRFRIAIRNINATEELVSQGIDSLKTKGFINYYGLQRFGASVIVPTHIVGLALIRKDWKEAVELLLKPRHNERCYPEVAEARKIWWETRDSKKASKCFSWKSPSLEFKVLQGLNKSGPTAYLNALENLPRNLLMFYGHAYQSLIWNKVVSRRIKEFGLTPMAGDIVFLGSCDNDSENDNQDLDNRSDKVDEDDQNEEIKNEENGENSKLLPDDLSIESFRNCKIKFLTEDEAKSANIEDIVYPVPGYEVQYPKNITASWYDEFLKEDNLSQESLADTKRYSHLFSMYGAYRKMVEKPEDVSWSLINYSDDNSDLLISDLDEMNGVKRIEDVPDGKYKALLIEMNLGPCAYATMALRELMKCETSSSFQASLTAQHKTDIMEDEQKTMDSKIKIEADNPNGKASENGENLTTDEVDMKEESTD